MHWLAYPVAITSGLCNLARGDFGEELDDAFRFNS
jgi:hypothetical protein